MRAEISVTVDAVVFGYKAGEGISALLIKRKNPPHAGMWALPGGFVDQNESLEEAVLRELLEETGIKVNYLEQLYTFGDPGRDPRGRTISIAYYGLVKSELYEIYADDDAAEVRWFNVSQVPKLAFDHKRIFDMALQRLRNKISYEPVGFELLDRVFTFAELHFLYETLYGRPIDRRNFKKKFLQIGVLRELKEKAKRSVGRPGTLYSFDRKMYFDLKNKGIHFEV